MIKPTHLRWAAFCLVLGVGIQAAQAVTLVRDGKPTATIVIAKAALDAKADKPAVGVSGKPEEKVRLAAEELQRYVEKISGAKLPIVGEDEATQGAVVLIGASKKTEPLNLNIPTG